MSLIERSKIVTISDGRQIQVNTMRHLPARVFLGIVAKEAASAFAEGGLADKLAKFNAAREEGTALNALASIIDTIPALIVRSLEASGHLLRNSTELTPQQIDDLYFPDALLLTEAAIEMNLTEELKKNCKGIVGRIGAFLAMKQ